MKIRLSFILIFILASKFTFSQSGWGVWQQLYNDNNITIDIQFYTSTNSCEDDGKPFKFKYRLNGYVTRNTQYVIWKMDYINCNNQLYFQQNYIAIGGNAQITKLGDSKLINYEYYENLDDMKFTGINLVEPFYEITTSSSKMSNSGIRVLPLSKVPTSIEGTTKIFLGKETELTVKGGALGTGAEWVWYKDQCGLNKIGTGETIIVQPDDSTNYFVRAEGKNNTTPCVQVKVDVDKRSIPPNSVIGDTAVCKGANTILTVEGGSLGLDADWVWYVNDCKGQKVGQGNSITVSPNQSTTYFVRAEGKLNKTECAKINLNVYEKSYEATSIIPTGLTTICEGNSIKLKVEGGSLSNGAQWKWYSGTCNGLAVATGSEVELKPLSSTTYFVRGEGYCNKTPCTSIVIAVNDKSYPPSSISTSKDVYKNKETTIIAWGGSLGNGAQWEWYKNSCSSSSRIGIGNSITIKVNKPTTFYVKAKGPCNETTCAQTIITPLKSHHWNHTYASRYKKFLQVGFGVGFEWLQFSELGNVKSTSNGNSTTYDASVVSINGLGLTAEVPFHPLMKDYLSLGFIPAYSIGTSPAALFSDDGNKSTKTEEYYFYQRFQLETELAFGLRPVKLLFKLNRSFQSKDYQKNVTTNAIREYTFTQNTNHEVISGGFRFGRYEQKSQGKRGNNFDLLYTLSRNHPDDMIAFSFKDYGYLSDWRVGASFTYWRQSALKIKFEMTLKSTQDEFSFDSNDFKSASYLVTLIYNRNWFY